MTITIIYILNTLLVFLSSVLIVQSACTLYRLRDLNINKKIFIYLEGYIALGAWTAFESLRYYEHIGELYPPSDVSWNIIIITFIYLAISHARFYKELYPQPHDCATTTIVKRLRLLNL